MRAYLARTETFVHNQLVALQRYRPVVLAPFERPDTDLPLDDGAIGRDLLPRPLAQLDSLVYRAARLPLPQSLKALADYARRQDTTLLHYHFVTDARLLIALKRQLRVPALVSAYGYDVSSFPRAFGGLGGRYLRPVFERMDLFLAMSDDMRRDLIAIGCPESKVRVHYHGIDTERFRWTERSYERDPPLNLLCCGRLTEAKGQRLVLEAVRILEARGLGDFHVTLVGDGPLRARLEAMIDERDWRRRVTLAGHLPYATDELVRQFRDGDVFVHPSITVGGLKEGIPGTIVEAMACGLAVVATWHAGIPAVIDDGRDGLLVDENDTSALADALERLLSDAALRCRIGTAAADRARRELDFHAKAVELEDIYDSLL